MYQYSYSYRKPIFIQLYIVNAICTIYKSVHFFILHHFFLLLFSIIERESTYYLDILIIVELGLGYIGLK